MRVMLQPNNWQTTRLFQYAGVARFAYNWALSREMESLKNGNGFISDGDLRKEFTQLKKQPEYNWLNEISNDVPKQAIKDLVQAYLRYFKLKKKSNYKPYTKKQIEHSKRTNKPLTEYDKQGHPKYKKKRDVSKYSFYNDAIKTIVTENHIRLSALEKHGKRKRQNIKNSIKLAERGRIPLNVKYYNPRISFDGLNWWLSVSVEVPENTTVYKAQTEGIGIDLGVKDLAILSDNTKYKNINKTSKVKKLEKRKRRLQRSVSRKYSKNKKGVRYQKTLNIKKAEKKLLKLNKRLTNIRYSYRDNIVEDIINRKPKFICIEDLNVSGMMKNKHLSKAIQDNGLREFRQILEYKTSKHCIPLIIADKWFPSSKLCNNCGCVKSNLKLSVRTYTCSCGYVEDRDINAAKNLKAYGEKLVLIA